MSVSTTIRCPFDVAKFDNYARDTHYNSLTNSVLNKDVPVSFALSVTPNDSREDYSQFLGVYLKYIDGPKDHVVVSYELLVVSDTQSFSIGKINDYRFRRRGARYGYPRYLPRSLDALTAGGYLKSNNTLLEIHAKITIPVEAFGDISDSRQVFYEPENVQVDGYRASLFKQLSTPAVTNEPSSDRFELVPLIGTGTSFWAHKNMLAYSSDMFKEWFDPNKPPQAQLSCFKRGAMYVDLSRDALWHMLYFVYLEKTARQFHKYALEILDIAERYSFKALRRICERSLMSRLDSMSMDSLFDCLEGVHPFGLPQLTNATINKLIDKLDPAAVYDGQDEQMFLRNLIDFAHQHNHAALKQACDKKLVGVIGFDADSRQFETLEREARRCGLDELSKWCAKWLARNNGELDRLVTDQSQEGRGSNS